MGTPLEKIMAAVGIAPLDAIAKSVARISALEIERQQKIESGEGDYAAVVARIDTELARLNSTIGIHRQRAEVMERRARKDAAARAEQERLAGVAAVRKRSAARLEAARKLDTAIGELSKAYTELLKADELLFRDWPEAVSNLGQLHHFHIDGMEPLSSHRRPRPPQAGLIRSIAEHGTFSIATAIETKNRELMEMIESAPAAVESGVAA